MSEALLEGAMDFAIKKGTYSDNEETKQYYADRQLKCLQDQPDNRLDRFCKFWAGVPK